MPLVEGAGNLVEIISNACGLHRQILNLAKIGNGGLCMECKVCTFPKCPFGKV